MNIALVNELAIFAHQLGIDSGRRSTPPSTKPFGFMRFTPGPGVGGHCLPVDPSYLSWRGQPALGRMFRFVELANDVNDHMPDYVVRRLIEALNRRRRAMNGSRVLLLGLALQGQHRRRPGVPGDPGRRAAAGARGRRSRRSTARGRAAPVPAAGPGRADPGELAAADLVVLLTDHDGFDYDLLAAGPPGLRLPPPARRHPCRAAVGGC